MLEWLWNYGSDRHLAKLDHQGRSFHCRWLTKFNHVVASKPRPKAQRKPRKHLPVAGKPLLRQVLCTAALKAQQAKISDVERMKSIGEDAAHAEPHLRRHPLSPVDKNRQIVSLARTAVKSEDLQIVGLGEEG